jgi:tetratricopeptide (TPR) repeat protein
VVRFPWQDDFSAARNAAIDATHGEWIFWMDADDRLEAPSARKLEELCRHPADGAFAFTVANERPGSPTTEFLQVRLFPRRNDLRFERCIHEQIMNATFRAGLPVTACGEIRIRHIGYQDPETHRRKAARNLPLILKELSRTPDDPSLLLSLGDCQWVLGRKTEATKTYRAIADNRECFETNRDVYVQAHVNVALLAYRRGDQHEAKQYLHRSLYLDEKRSEAWYHLGLLYRQEHREDRALDCLIRAATEKPPIRLTAVNNLSVKLNAIYTVADMLMARYCYHEAEKILLHATASYPQVCTFHAQLGMVRLAQDRLTEAAANFMDSINLDPANNPLAYRGMAEIYELLGDEKRAAQYSAASLQHVG